MSRIHWIVIIVFILLFSLWQITIDRKQDKTRDDGLILEKLPMEKNNNEPINYSRVSFFITAPVVASLAIPEDWEGKYRVQEEKNIARFSYIENPEKEIGLFSVLYYLPEEWDKINNSGNNKLQLISIFGGVVFAYSLSTDDSTSDNENFAIMKRTIPAIIASFKPFLIK